MAGGAALAGVSAAAATAMVLQADRKASTAMPKPAGDELYEYEYYDDDVAGARHAGVGGVGSAAIASTAGLGAACSSSTGVAACAASALQGSTAGGTASATGVGAAQEEYEYYSDAPDAGTATQPPPVAARAEEDEYEYYSEDAPEEQGATAAAARAGDAPGSAWDSLAESRSKDMAAQRSEYLQRHTAALRSGAADVNAAEEENDECVLSVCRTLAVSHAACPALLITLYS